MRGPLWRCGWAGLLLLGAGQVQAAGDVVASVGKIEVTRQQIAARIAALPDEQRRQLVQDPAPLEQWIRSQFAEQLLLQEAAAQQWEKQPEVARDIEAVTQEVIARSYLQRVSQVPEGYPGDAELQAAWSRAKVNLVKPARYRISQLFLPARADDAQTQAKARINAAEMVQKARRPKADFDKLVEEYGSTGNGTQKETGWVTLAQLLPEVRPVIASLKPGTVSEPVQSQAGLHVLKLIEVREPEQATLDEVRDALTTRLRQQRQAQIANAYLDSLANSQNIKIDRQALIGVLTAETKNALVGE